MQGQGERATSGTQREEERRERVGTLEQEARPPPDPRYLKAYVTSRRIDVKMSIITRAL